MKIELGTYLILRANGTEELVREKPSIRKICQQIGCETLDSVNLRNNSSVMLVDDNGLLAEPPKPLNRKATELYRSVCRPGTNGIILGDAAVVNDEDFAR